MVNGWMMETNGQTDGRDLEYLLSSLARSRRPPSRLVFLSLLVIFLYQPS